MGLGDRIEVMNEGRFEQVAKPRDVYRVPATEFVAKFIGEVNILPCLLYRGSAYAGNLAIRMEGNGIPFHGETVKVLLRPEDVTLLPRGIAEPGQTHASVKTVSWLGAKEPEYFL